MAPWGPNWSFQRATFIWRSTFFTFSLFFSGLLLPFLHFLHFLPFLKYLYKTPLLGPYFWQKYPFFMYFFVHFLFTFIYAHFNNLIRFLPYFWQKFLRFLRIFCPLFYIFYIFYIFLRFLRFFTFFYVFLRFFTFFYVFCVFCFFTFFNSFFCFFFIFTSILVIFGPVKPLSWYNSLMGSTAFSIEVSLFPSGPAMYTYIRSTVLQWFLFFDVIWEQIFFKFPVQKRKASGCYSCLGIQRKKERGGGCMDGCQTWLGVLMNKKTLCGCLKRIRDKACKSQREREGLVNEIRFMSGAYFMQNFSIARKVCGSLLSPHR